ncbi:MAG: hypothetical protein ACYCY6_00840 [Minisyncoccota bacterium]
MKKLGILIFIFAILGGGWYIWHKDSESEDIVIAPVVTEPDPSNATFRIGGEAVTLENGRSSKQFSPSSAVTLDTILTDIITYGDINDDSKNDTVAIIMQSGGGSGMFVYVVAYVSGNVNYEGSNAVLIGDRVSPEELSINNGVISITYLDRDPSEALAVEPTIRKELELVYKGGNLEER